MGQHMRVSVLSAPHGFVAVEVDASVFNELDAQGRETREGFVITDESVVTIAAVRALAEFEFLNATFANDQLTVHRTISVGFTRHVDDDGMLVPVVHAAAGLTLRALSRRTAELDERLHSRQLNADDLMGGTFTVASATSEHTLWTEPIIIQPQVAVLSIGAVRHVPVVAVREGVPVLEVGRRVILGLTFDHRVCDAAAAAKYLERVGELLAGLDVASER
jgi:2-oxoglutarate dehydrogenase E2 component (dihydrolipoamide succinyltransferase)